MQNLILIGYMGSGKTSVGKLLSKKIRYNFIDTDYLIEKNEEMTIPEIFKIFGEKYFRNRENRLIFQLAKKKLKIA